MAIPDPQTVADRWATGLQNAQTKMQQGVQAVTVSPGDKAIANGAAYLANVTEAYTSGRWARGLQRSGLAGWQGPMLAEGIQRAVSGAQTNKQKFADRIAPVLQFETGLKTQIDSMPNVTPADKENRMLAWSRGMRQFKAQR